MSINVHELVHLPDSLKYNGSGYSNSTFGFEEFNRIFGNFIHGTKSVEKEMFKRHEMFKNAILSVYLDVIKASI